jgi:hypothetical protein
VRTIVAWMKWKGKQCRRNVVRRGLESEGEEGLGSEGEEGLGVMRRREGGDTLWV